MRPWVRCGLWAGAAFCVAGVAFVAASLFTDISPAWIVLNTAKGAVGFAFCGLAGLLAARRTGHARSGAAAGALGGFIAGLAVPASMYIFAYAFLDSVRQYPFEYYDFLQSGTQSVQEFLLSSKGHATVRSTSLGLVPVVMAFAALTGALAGYSGGIVGNWRSGALPSSPTVTREQGQQQQTRCGAHRSALAEGS
jgi:hypothetical protein